MRFDLPLVLAAAPILGALVFFLASTARRARIRALLAWAPALATRTRGPDRAGPWLLAVAALAAGVGAAGPRWGRSEIAVEARALNLAIGVDVSRSMLAEDVAPSRLRRAIGEARRLVQDARGDRLALLAFAGRSYILTPLTLDDGAVALQLDALDPEIASEGGTDLAEVLAQGRGLLDAAYQGGARVLVVFTDGETHGSVEEAIAAARQIRNSRITLVLVAEGDTVPARIPLRDERGQLTGWKTDADGRVVRTVRRDDVLRQVADASGGVLIGAEIADQEGAIWSIVAGLERRAAEERRREDLVPRGWLFALVALLAVAAQALPRRSGALVALALAVGAPARAQRPAPGQRLLTRGDTLAAAVAFAREAATTRGRDTALFNAGTTAMAAGQHQPARELLEQAARSLDPDLRFRSIYNLGVSFLLESRRDTAQRQALEAEAARHFREALLLAPRSAEAKWNLELVSRRTPPPPSGGGPSSTPPPPTPEPPEPRPSGGALSQNEADQILNSVERAERAVRNELSRRRRYAQSAAGKDW